MKFARAFTAFVATWLLLGLCVPAYAQRKSAPRPAKPAAGKKFKIGDRVETNLANTIQAGTVQSVDEAGGMLTVAFDDPAWGTRDWPTQNFQVSKTKAPAAAPAKVKFKVGDRVQAEMAARWEPATVDAVDEASGNLKVTFDERWGTIDWPIQNFRPLAKKDEPPAKAPFKVGDRIATTSGGWTGTVVGVDDPTPGQLDVKWDGGDWGTSPWPKDSCLHLKAAGKAVGGAGGATPDKTASAGAKKPAPSKNELRTWTDRSGKHKVEATLVKVEDDRVFLKRKEGKEISLPLANLSDADQEFLKSDPASRDASDLPLAEFDLASAPLLDLKATTAWTYKPEEVADEVLPECAIELAKTDYWERPKSMRILSKVAKAVVFFENSQKTPYESSVFVCDLKKKKLASRANFVPGQLPICVTEDMSRVLASSSGWGHGKNDTLYLYDIDGKKVKALAAWKPFAGASFPDVVSSSFLDKNVLLTTGNDHNTVLWDLANGVQPIYMLKDHWTTTVHSPSGKYLAATTDSGISLFETRTGKPVGQFKLDNTYRSHMAFDAQGRRFALMDDGRVRVWDLEKRALAGDFYIDAANQYTLHWIDPDYLLIGTKLVDVGRRIVAWQFNELAKGGEIPNTVQAGNLWRLEKRDSGYFLVGKSIPTNGARDMLKDIQPDDLVVIHPGMNVGVDIQLGAFAGVRERVATAVTKQLEKGGMKLVELATAPVKLLITVQPGAAKSVKLQAFGGGAVTDHSVAEQIVERSYIIGGKAVWKNKYTISPSSFSVGKNESIDQAIGRAIQESVASAGDWFVPTNISSLPDGFEPGKS